MKTRRKIKVKEEKLEGVFPADSGLLRNETYLFSHKISSDILCPNVTRSSGESNCANRGKVFICLRGNVLVSDSDTVPANFGAEEMEKKVVVDA